MLMYDKPKRKVQLVACKIVNVSSPLSSLLSQAVALFCLILLGGNDFTNDKEQIIPWR